MCRVYVSISFLSFVLHCIFNSNVNCFCVDKCSSSSLPWAYLYLLYCIFLTVYRKRWVFIVNCVCFLRDSAVNVFHAIIFTVISWGQNSKLMYIQNFMSVFFFSFSKSRSYSRGALLAWAGQFKPFGNTIYLQKASALCSAYLLFLSSPENESKLLSSIQTEMLSHHVTSHTVSYHPPFLVMHVQSVRLRVPLVPPVSKGALLGRKLLLLMVVSLMFHFFKRLSQY